jgi:HEAT repeat protein
LVKRAKCLGTALKETDSYVQVPALWALGKLGSSLSVDSLIESLKNTDWYIRWGAADALGKIGDKSALEPLAQLKGDSDDYVQRAASEAIEKIRLNNLRGVEMRAASADRFFFFMTSRKFFQFTDIVRSVSAGKP